jgi:hypothetical protein
MIGPFVKTRIFWPVTIPSAASHLPFSRGRTPSRLSALVRVTVPLWRQRVGAAGGVLLQGVNKFFIQQRTNDSTFCRRTSTYLPTKNLSG